MAALREMREEVADAVDAYLGAGPSLPWERLCRGVRLPGLVSAVARQDLAVSLLAAPRVLERSLEGVDELVDLDVACADLRKELVNLGNVVLGAGPLKELLGLLLGEIEPVPVKLAREDLAAGRNVVLAVNPLEPGLDLGPRARGPDIAVLRVEPVAAGVRLFLGDYLDLLAGLERVGERDNLVVDLPFGVKT